MRRLAASAVVVLAATAGASDYSAQGGSIPDQIPGPPTQPGVFTSDIVVVEDYPVANILVTLQSLVHPYCGDLIVSITHVENGHSAILVSRIGKTSPRSGFGDSSNFGGSYTFGDFLDGNIWQVAAGGGSSFTLPTGEYFASAPLTGAEVNVMSLFPGETSAGTWQLKITDNAAADVGAFSSWILSLDPPTTTGADLDGDGVVGPADLAILLGQWGGPGNGDLDGDGVVGPADLGILLGAWDA